VKSALAPLLLGLLTASLVGCVTPGPAYDDSKVAMIQRDLTSEADLLQ
jgi:hypothetical protein